MTAKEKAVEIHSVMDGNRAHSIACVNYLITTTGAKFWYIVKEEIEKL
jgi:hypothetical protein